LNLNLNLNLMMDDRSPPGVVLPKDLDEKKKEKKSVVMPCGCCLREVALVGAKHRCEALWCSSSGRRGPTRTKAVDACGLDAVLTVAVVAVAVS